MFSLAVSYLFPSDSATATNNQTAVIKKNLQEPEVGWMTQMFLKYSPRDAEHVEAVKKCIYVHEVLSSHIIERCATYYKVLLNYHADIDPSFNDEQRFSEICEQIEEQIERSIEDMVICIKGLCAGYLVQAGASREEVLKVGQPIELEQAFEKKNHGYYISRLSFKVPERTSSYELITDEAITTIQKIQKYILNEVTTRLFVTKKITEIYNRVDHIENMSCGRFLLGGGIVWVQMSKEGKQQILLD